MSGGFRTLGGGLGGGDTIVNNIYKTKHIGPKGYAVGDAESYVGRAFQAAGGLDVISGEGIDGDTVYVGPAGLITVAKGVIDATGNAQALTLRPEMMDCEIFHVSFRGFSGAPPANLRGGIYATPTAVAGAMIIPDTTRYDDWPGGLAVLRKDAPMELRQPTALWWVPSVKASAALTFEVHVRGIPTWQRTWA